MSSNDNQSAKISIGISACILGQEVRFNGGHKLDRFVRDTLGTYVEFVPVCPEVDIGLGVPRETLRLVHTDDGPSPWQMVANKSGTDHTAKMLGYARTKCSDLRDAGLCGYILQKGSPSCGMERVKVYGKEGAPPARHGVGLFAGVLMEHMPYLPVEEDGRLNDPRLRENFVERIFAYRRLRTLFERRWKAADLVAFHTREKLLLMAHDRPAFQELGRLVAKAKSLPREEVVSIYQRLFLTGLKKIATTRKHTNVLQHISGFFKKALDSADRNELHAVIESFHQGLVPLVVPITLIRHHVRRQDLQYLAEQTYLDPHPTELMLRNHV